MTLLDTNVLSELSKPTPSLSVLDFVESLDQAETFASVISIGELTYGVARMSVGRRQRALADWLETFLEDFQDRTIAPDLETARIWGELSARMAMAGSAMSKADAWIAATALQNGLILATRNVRDFQHSGVELINPW